MTGAGQWIDHLVKPLPKLTAVLEKDNQLVLFHKDVYGELLIGNHWKTKEKDLKSISRLNEIRYPTEIQIHLFICNNKLEGKGIGWIDSKLLAACFEHNALLWTNDKRLHALAQSLNLAYGCGD